VIKNGARTTSESLYACRFVPLLGKFGWSENKQEINSK
jgi:hypothetical protein